MHRHLSSRLFSSNKLSDFHPLYDFLSTLSHDGQSLMLNERITGPKTMAQALDNAEKFLSELDDEVSSFAVMFLACLLYLSNSRQTHAVSTTCSHLLIGV
jgi:hypothetical protein